MQKVGIVIINYNGYEDTVECIESLKNMTYSNYEIIVIDNASTDDSYEKLRAYKETNIHIIRSKINSGFSGGNNIGIRKAVSLNCDYVLMINNDTYVNKKMLAYMIKCEEKYDNKVAVVAKIYYAKKPDTIWYAGGKINFLTGRTEHYGIHQKDNSLFEKEKEVSFATGCCVLLPICIIKKIGLMEEKYFLYCEDIEYSLRILKHKFKIIYAPKAIVYHKISSSTQKISSISTYYMVRNKRIVIKEYMRGIPYVIAKIYNYLEETKRIISGEYTINTVRQARKDYKAGVIGIKKG